MDLKPGDLLFVWGNNLVEEIIEHVTHGPSHCSMFIDENTLIEAQYGREVGTQNLSFYLSQNCRLEVWEDPSLLGWERGKLIDQAQKAKGVPYDNLLIPLELLHFECGLDLRWYHDNKGRICSTLIYQLGKSVGRKWSKVLNPAPINLMDGGILTLKEDNNGLRRITTTAGV